jgi:hypothetical protein
MKTNRIFSSFAEGNKVVEPGRVQSNKRIDCVHSRSPNHWKGYLFAFAMAVLVPIFANALTPISRWDIVPHQRLDYGATLNVGVVAFSKAGINHISFVVAGQGYSGPSPITVSAMSYNSQTKVYEYWFPLASSSFSTDGVFTIAATAYGSDAGALALPTYSFVVNATGSLPAPKAWVSATGNDSTGAVNDRTHPFSTTTAAVVALNSANGGSFDGAILYLYAGTWAFGSLKAVTTTNEWFTIAADPSADQAYTIVNNGWGVSNTKFLQFQGITLTGQMNLGEDANPLCLWVNLCAIQGGGQWVGNSNPIMRGNDESDSTAFSSYYTDTQISNVDEGIQASRLARNVTIEHIGNDAFFRTLCVINAVVIDKNPGTTYWHSDGFQSFGTGLQNGIVYGFYGYNMRYQGLFLREENGGQGNNNAFVNMFIDMRQPGLPGAAGSTDFVCCPCYIAGGWDHLLLWNCSFLGGESQFIFDTGYTAFTPTNCSIKGCVFDTYIDWANSNRLPVYSLHGNIQNNEFLYNHYRYSRTDGTGGVTGTDYNYASSPDSGATTTHTFGNPGIDLSLNSPMGFYGVPIAGSPLLNKFSPPIVLIDALGRQRDAASDIGAIERMGNEPAPPTSPSKLKDLRIIP